MSIYTSPPDRNVTGRGATATGKLVVKLPPNNIYFTLGSVERILSTKKLRKWYGMPLYNGKRRRIGNLDEAFIASSNHGQVPGFVIYKLFTEDEIRGGVEVKETASDYPTVFAFQGAKELYQIIGGEVSIPFVNSVINGLIR
jgi:hypothetical protein